MATIRVVWGSQLSKGFVSPVHPSWNPLWLSRSGVEIRLPDFVVPQAPMWHHQPRCFWKNIGRGFQPSTPLPTLAPSAHPSPPTHHNVSSKSRKRPPQIRQTHVTPHIQNKRQPRKTRENELRKQPLSTCSWSHTNTRALRVHQPPPTRQRLAPVFVSRHGTIFRAVQPPHSSLRSAVRKRPAYRSLSYIDGTRRSISNDAAVSIDSELGAGSG